MRTRRLTFFVPGLALAACVATALGLGSDIPAEHPVGAQDGWPAGLADLLNSGGRVGGFFVNANDWFFFQGDAKAFNAWLEKYAALKDTPLQLVLHPGRTTDRRPWSKEGEARLPVDWQVDVINRQWTYEAIDEKHPVKPGHDVTVHVFLGGQVGLDDLDVPLGVSVESGGEIEEFVVHHQAKQSLGRRDARPKPPAATPGDAK